jgi:predicted lipid-binding transport protein (Tim44 family)
LPVRPTVHSAVLPAVTPDSATDFLGLSRRGRALWGALMGGLLYALGLLGLGEQRVELLFVGVVAEVVVQLLAGLHGVTTFFWCPSRRMRLVDVQGRALFIAR